MAKPLQYDLAKGPGFLRWAKYEYKIFVVFMTHYTKQLFDESGYSLYQL